ncbi:hypothetical protein AAFC00_003694 [Neodothiora populina]|uniref:Zn(2)-C6 fungal-type domain-containing protein n=1 Tax=Neodothiora populina TaxID=2781224 RepID=A0ABR3PF37_9PEZI
MAPSPSTESQTRDDIILCESIEEFGRQYTSGVFETPSSPAMEPPEIDNTTGMSSVYSSDTGEVQVLTPSSTSDEDQLSSSASMGDGNYEILDLVTTPQVPNPALQALGSPASSSDGFTIASFDTNSSSRISLSPVAFIPDLAGSYDYQYDNDSLHWSPQLQNDDLSISSGSSLMSSFPDLALLSATASQDPALALAYASNLTYPILSDPFVPSYAPQHGYSVDLPPGTALQSPMETNASAAQHLTPLFPDQELSESPTSMISSAQGQWNASLALSYDVPQPVYEASNYPTSQHESYEALNWHELTAPSVELAMNPSIQDIANPPSLSRFSSSSNTPRADEYIPRSHPENTHREQQQSLKVTPPPQHQRRQAVRSRSSRQSSHSHSPGSSTLSSPSSITSPTLIKGVMKGGRKGPLREEGRKHAADMRGDGCWPCAIMREKCSKGEPCTRCASKSHQSKAHGLGCDRRHLNRDMWCSFIPSSMDPGQRYADMMAYVNKDVAGWYDHPSARRGIYVPFSIGIGQPLTWLCHEYQPSMQNTSHNISWNIGGHGDTWRRTYSLSPPLALRSLDQEYLNVWMDHLIEHNLEDVQDMYYWEGHQMRTQVLILLCSLYDGLRRQSPNLSKTSAMLKDDVRNVITLMLVTYVMNHAFTVEEELRDSVIRQLSRYNDPSLYAEMVILKTANSQLKYGFSKLRLTMHRALLARLQTIMRNAKYKDWWLSGFVVMLGLALTLEEYQHLLHVQADSRIAEGKDPARSMQRARDHCTEIDEGFEFLLKLYHFRYSARGQDKASFAQWTEHTSNPAEAHFVAQLPELVAQYRIVLLQRKDLEVCLEEDNHVLRLASRFLTGVM